MCGVEGGGLLGVWGEGGGLLGVWGEGGGLLGVWGEWGGLLGVWGGRGLVWGNGGKCQMDGWVWYWLGGLGDQGAIGRWVIEWADGGVGVLWGLWSG